MSATLTDEPAATPPAARTVHPAKWWYALFAGLIAASLIAGGAIWFLGRRSVDNQIASYARFVAPNTADLRFKRPGQYLVYYEYDSEIDGERVTAPAAPPPGIALDLKDENGESLELRRVGQEFRYDTGDHRAVSLRRVTIPLAGLYRLSASAPGVERFVIAVGRGSTPTTDGSTRVAVLVGSIGALLGVIGLVTIGVLRSRSRAGLTSAVGPSAWSSSPDALPAPPPGLPAASASEASPPPPPPPPPPPVGEPLASPSPSPVSSIGWAPPAAGTATEPGAADPPPAPLPPPRQ